MLQRDADIITNSVDPVLVLFYRDYGSSRDYPSRDSGRDSYRDSRDFPPPRSRSPLTSSRDYLSR